MEPKKSNRTIITTTIVVLMLAVASYLFVQSSNKQEATTQTSDNTVPTTPTTPTTVPSTTPTSTPVTPPVTAQLYKDGTYSAEGTYGIPEGSEQIKVTLTVTKDIVTDASVVTQAQRGESRQYQAMFASGFKPLVIGKKLSTLSLTKVSGSSLTPRGFNDAVAQIKVQAKS